jgi:hypothetical protein
VDKSGLTEGFLLFSKGEREVLIDALAEGHTALVAALVKARRLSSKRRDSDRETDVGRRLTCGARLPRHTVERYRQCAREHDMSLYSFACSALEREYRRLGGPPGSSGRLLAAQRAPGQRPLPSAPGGPPAGAGT